MVNAPGFHCSGADMHRVFIVSYHLDDDTLEVAEPPNKATRTGGPCFLARARLAKPCMHDPYGSDGEYNRRDMFVGAFVPLLLRARKGFEAEGPKMLWLVEADEWTLDAMESRPQDFPASDVAAVCGKAGAQLQEPTRAARVSELLSAQALGGTVAVDAFAVRSWPQDLICGLPCSSNCTVPNTDGHAANADSTFDVREDVAAELSGCRHDSACCTTIDLCRARAGRAHRRRL